MIDKLKSEEVWIQRYLNSPFSTQTSAAQPFTQIQSTVDFQEFVVFQKINEIIDKINELETKVTEGSSK